jgi:hypothetical protein
VRLHLIDGQLEFVRTSAARGSEVAQGSTLFYRKPTNRSSASAEMKNCVRAMDQTSFGLSVRAAWNGAGERSIAAIKCM